MQGKTHLVDPVAVHPVRPLVQVHPEICRVAMLHMLQYRQEEFTQLISKICIYII